MKKLKKEGFEVEKRKVKGLQTWLIKKETIEKMGQSCYCSNCIRDKNYYLYEKRNGACIDLKHRFFDKKINCDGFIFVDVIFFMKAKRF